MSTERPLSADQDLRERLDRVQTIALVIGCVGLAVCVGAGLLRPAHFIAPYLVGYLDWLGITLGCLGFAMLHHLVGGSWGLVIRRPLEAGAVTVIPLAVLFLPIAIGVRVFYPWARVGSGTVEAAMGQSAYLNVPFFLSRALVYFVIWGVTAFVLFGGSRRQDLTTGFGPSRRLARLSGPGTVILFLTGTFSAVDWVMSLEPRWVSTIYGAMLITGDAMATLALMIAVSCVLARSKPMSEIATPERLNDLGNLLLAFVMLWAYMSFCQFLIIWSGNLSEEIPWYLRRMRGGWEWVALGLITCQFFLPFFILLFRENKRDPRLLVWISLGILLMRWVDLTWLVIPATADPASPIIPWGEVLLGAVASIGVGGIWLAVFIGPLKRLPLVPLHDPNLIEAVEQLGVS
jgi:hypothetical protein